MSVTPHPTASRHRPTLGITHIDGLLLTPKPEWRPSTFSQAFEVESALIGIRDGHGWRAGESEDVWLRRVVSDVLAIQDAHWRAYEEAGQVLADSMVACREVRRMIREYKPANVTTSERASD